MQPIEGQHAAARVERRRARGPAFRLTKASGLWGERVVSRDGESLGTVHEIMLDLERGRIAYAVLGSGGFMGVGERLSAVPWQALRLDAARHHLVLDADKQTFDTAPCFDKEHWPEEFDARWHQRVHRHYGLGVAD